MDIDAWPRTQPELTDGTITLRPWRASDDAFVFRACQDDAVQRWTRIGVPCLLDDATGFVARWAPHQWNAGTGASFAIVDGARDVVVGSMGLVRIDRSNHLGEAGYWMDAHQRGRGLAARALDLLSAWTLTTGRLARVELRIEVDNVASRKVATNAGFALEGVMRRAAWHRGEHCDVALYARID
ncbi:MAG: GNAT family N-acetyltransferase [Acidobacteria bacterium]|nr:GNAT family N-acetyltransferase [Acidobacteriota bacterium]